jgi:uncharacterized cupin superfamily protein
MLKPIINIADVSLDPTPPKFAPTGPAAERFEAKTGVIGARVGARKLGYNITAVPPGKRAWPFHNHPAKEEMFFVLQGSGEVRRTRRCRSDVRQQSVGGIAARKQGRTKWHQ